MSNSLFGEIVDCADDSVTHQRRTKIHKQAELFVGKSQVGLKLLAVDLSNIFHRFEFKNDKVIDDDIGLEAFVELKAIVADRNRNLADT